jgi:hypothetical protein
MTRVMFLIVFSMPRNYGGFMEGVWRDWGEIESYLGKGSSPVKRGKISLWQRRY